MVKAWLWQGSGIRFVYITEKPARQDAQNAPFGLIDAAGMFMFMFMFMVSYPLFLENLRFNMM